MKVGKAVKLDCSRLLIHNSANIVGIVGRGGVHRVILIKLVL